MAHCHLSFLCTRLACRKGWNGRAEEFLMSETADRLAKHPNRRLLPFFRRLGPNFDSFEARGTDLVRKPVGLFLASFNFYPKEGMPNARWLKPYCLPLYVPSDLHISYGRRIPPNPNPGLAWFWVYLYNSEVEPELDAIRILREYGLPMLSELSYTNGFLSFIDNLKPAERCNRLDFDKAGTLACLNRWDEALACERSYQGLLDYRDATWPNDMGVANDNARNRQWAFVLHALIKSRDRAALLDQFRIWREENIERFGLEDIALSWEESLRQDRIANELHAN